MKKKMVRIAAATGCAAVASAYMLTVFAENADSGEKIKLKINKPYLNIQTVDGKGAAVEKINFELRDKDGKSVAVWTAGDEASAQVTGPMLLDSNTWGVKDFPCDDYKPPEMKEGTLYEGFDKLEPNADGSYPMKLNKDYTYYYRPDFEADGEIMTVSANQCVVAIDPAYSNRARRTSAAIGSVHTVDALCFNDFAGQTITYNSVSTGEHAVGMIGQATGGNYAGTGGWLQVEDHSVEYVKMTVNIGELSSKYFNNDATYTSTVDGVTRSIDLKGTGTAGNYCHFYFLSGSVISAPIPDANGNVSVWVSKDDPRVGLATGFDTENNWAGGGRNGTTVKNYTPEKVGIPVEIDFTLPDKGFSLYDIPSGEYTVVTDSEEYELVNSKVNVTDTKDLQSLIVTVKEKSDETSSSDVSSSKAESSSEATSSSEVDSSSAADPVTDLSSSQADSSSASSSLASSSSASSSKSSSKASSSSASKGSSATKDANPATGAVTGGLLTFLFAAGIVVAKKNNK